MKNQLQYNGQRQRLGRVTSHPRLLCAALALISIRSIVQAGGEGGSTAAPANPPSTVANRVTEADLTTVTLTPEAVARLNIQTEVAQEASIGRSRFFGGEVITPPGRTIQLSAPFAGTIAAIEGQSPPTPGSALKAGDAIVALHPVVMGDREILTPSERIALAKAEADFGAAQALAEGEVNAARVQVEASRVRLDRAKRLRQENATSIKALNEAEAEFDTAQARLAAATANATAWKDAAQSMKPDHRTGVKLVAPFDCVLADLSVMPGEIVASNAVVARLTSPDPLWVRVPVYVGDSNKLVRTPSARIGELDRRLRPDMTAVDRVAGPPSADPIAATVDLFFRLPNPDGRYHPLQRVGVWIPDGDERRGLVIPWAAVVHDIHGGAWVYEQTAPGRFMRRRAEVTAVEGDRALTSRGLRAGMTLVTTGTAELFGVEFGVGK